MYVLYHDRIFHLACTFLLQIQSNGYGKLVKNDFSRTYERNVKSHTKNYAGHKMIKNVDWNSKAALFEGANIIKHSSEFQNCMVC